MAYLTGLIIKVAERCNLNCSYCYMYNHVDQSFRSRPKFMTTCTFERLVGRIREHQAQSQCASVLKLVFHGGEPMLIDVSDFAAMLECARSQLGESVALAMQTNGTLVTDRWLDVLRAYQVHVGISIDGRASDHDRFRVFHDGRGSHHAVISGVKRITAAGLRPSALCVINPECCGVDVYRYIRSLGFATLDLLLPDRSHDEPRWFHCRSTTPVADFLIPVFDEWYTTDDERIRIRLFEALLRSIRGGQAGMEGFGRRGTQYLVIDTDGSMHGNDALKVCAPELSNSRLNIHDHSFEELRTGAPLIYMLTAEGLPTASQCKSCPEVSVCGGGPPPGRYSAHKGFNNPSVWCADLRRLIAHIRATVPRDWASVASGPPAGLPEPIPELIPWQ